MNYIKIRGSGRNYRTWPTFGLLRYSFVETSGETASGSAASGADCGTEAVGDGVRTSTGAVVGEGGSGVARIGEDGKGADWRR